MLNKTIFGKYAIEDQVKENDLLIDYRGKETQTGHPMAAAALKPEIVPAADFLSRFEPIAKAIAKIESPHTVAVLEYGEVEGQAVIVREGIEGQSLADLAAGGSGLQIDIVLDIARQLGEYLDAIHQGSIFQGAFSPDNVLLSADGVVRVTDLGMAQGLNIGELLAADKVKAQPFHAPELLRGEKADTRTDFYSLGAVLYEVLTGKELEAGAAASDQTLIVDLFPSRLRLGVPPELDELVAKCLHPIPAKRIQSAAEFLNRIAEVHRGMAEGAQATVIGMEDSLMGQTLGAYRLVERLGQGGMATVYKGYEAALDRYVAVKVLPQFFASDPSFAQRFRREAKAVAQLNHPNIIPIYSYGEESGITYLVMQFVEGGTLKHERGEAFTPADALRLLLPIARALGYAHGRGIVHRDIKPSNVLIAEGNWPMLADFGLAQMAESSMKLTGTGVGLGTPMYMSPEQGRGDKVDARTDIYSLGIMLYELVTGDVPFRADTPMAIVIKHMTAPMPMPRQISPDIPEEVENIILKATAKDPQDRYSTAEEMVTAMERVLSRLTAAEKGAEITREEKPVTIKPAAEPAPKPPASRKWIKSCLFALLGVIGFCLLAVILMGIFDICPPVGPWPQPPWCPGSPYKLPTFGGGEEPTATPNWSATLQASHTQDIDLPTQPPAGTTSAECQTVNYIVQTNDTLGTIAASFKVPMEAIKEWNSLTSDSISLGQNLIIPLCMRSATYTAPTTAPPASQRPVCAQGTTELLYEDFEDQQAESAGWSFRDELLNQTEAWPIIADDKGNYVWVGSDDARAAWMDFSAYNYIVRLRMRMRDLDSELFVIFRIDSRPNGLYGYYFSTESGLLTKNPPGVNLARSDRIIKDLSWHELVISAIDGQIGVLMDGESVLQYLDEDPYSRGWIELQSRRGTIWYDDILICSVTDQ